MNEETMRKHYERMPIDNLINILISSRREIERLNNIINEIEKYAGLGELNWEDKYQDIMLSSKGLLKRIKELKGDE